jgi:uncharacterized protein (TIGR03067 family)
MKTIAILILLTGPLSPREGPQEADLSKNDLAKLTGTWVSISLVSDGKTLIDEKTPPAERARTKLVYDGNKWMVKVGDKIVANGIIAIDATKTPKEIDVTDGSGTRNEKTRLGIYELDGDTYRYCIAAPGAPRPQGFVSRAGTRHSLGVSKREKP